MARPVNKLLPIHPGELLREDMDALGLSVGALAEAIAVPRNRIAAILRGERSITADTGLRLAVYFGTRRRRLDESANDVQPQESRAYAWCRHPFRDQAAGCIVP
jgi:addiction module HigA family antidote